MALMSDLDLIRKEWEIPRNVGVNKGAMLAYGASKFTPEKYAQFQSEVEDFFQYIAERHRAQR